MRSSSSSQRVLSSSSSEGASRGSGARAAMSESVMRESAPSSRSRRRQPETAAAVTPASAARSAARSPASSRATSSIFLSKGKCTAFLRGGGATPAAFAQFTTAVRLQPASSAASVRLNPAATASTASSLVSNGYMRTPIRTPECPTFCPHPLDAHKRTITPRFAKFSQVAYYNETPFSPPTPMFRDFQAISASSVRSFARQRKQEVEMPRVVGEGTRGFAHNATSPKEGGRLAEGRPSLKSHKSSFAECG